MGYPKTMKEIDEVSDYWLDQVTERLERVLENPNTDSGSYFAGPLALVVSILFARAASHELEVSQAHLYQCLRSYRIEVMKTYRDGVFRFYAQQFDDRLCNCLVV